MTVQPKFHWQFTTNPGSKAVDRASGVTAELFHVRGGRHGRIGQAIRLDGRKDKPRMVFGNAPGRVGTRDFTIAFGMKVRGTFGEKVLHIIGNRTTSGHGNFFSLRMKKEGELVFEVDENSKGKNYAVLNSKRSLKDGKWHHIAIVRQGRSLKLYIDGELSEESRSKTGIANITTKAAMSLGTRGRKTPIAEYEDIRIYHTALSTADIRDLVTPENRPLRAGEIELVATDNAAIVLKQDATHLTRFSPRFQQVRLGADTGVTLYKGTEFSGVRQKLAADIPDTRLSRLGDFPRSIQIRSTVGEPFMGKHVIQAPNGEYLSQQGATLTTSRRRKLTELFDLRKHPQRDRLELIPASKEALQIDGETAVLLMDDAERPAGAFAIVHPVGDQWLMLNPDKTFSWTQVREDRAICHLTARMADHEGQVGELAPGEVALYENVAYWGRTWVLSDREPGILGSYARFGPFHGLNDKTSSIRVGPETGVTLFKHGNFQAADANREEEIEDIVENVPDMGESQVGDDAISSVKIFQTLSAKDVFASYTTKLSQDYRMVNGKLEEFSAYRTTLRFEPGAGAVTVAATDFTTIEVDGKTHIIDEEQSVELRPNELNVIMITSEADGLNTPGLKIRTSEMALNEQVVIFPNQDAHQQIAELEDDALWNAKDAQGNLIVDRNAHSQAEVASVQNTIKRVTATVAYDEAIVADDSVASEVTTAERVVLGEAIDAPWELTFSSEPDTGDAKRRSVARSVRRSRGPVAASVAADDAGDAAAVIQETPVSQDAFAKLLSQATITEGPESAAPSDPAPSKPGVGGLGGAQRVLGIKKLRIGRRIRDAVKKATSVVVGAVEGVVHFVVKTAEGVIDFVVDTVEKIGEFVESVVEKVVSSIKQFIEFLQFLFDWGDILDTQRYLKKAINSSLDAAKQLAVDAKPHVKAFVDDLQEDVEDGMNQLVKSLGGKPSEVEESGFEIPEALEWFLSKLMGGSRSASSEPGSAGGSDSPLASFVRQLLEAFEDAAGAGLRVSEGVFDSIQALIKNPREPEVALIIIIEALRDAIIQSLEAVENLALSLLDVVASIIDLFKVLLNAEIRIPFISDLLDFIGVGKLTVLNLATMTLAIPVTLTAKLATGRHLFAESIPVPLDVAQPAGTPLALASFERSALTANAVVADDIPTIANAEAEDEPDSLRELRRDLAFTVITTTADTVNHLIAGILDLFNVPGFGADIFPERDLTKIDVKLGVIGVAFVGPLQALEITSLGLSFMSWVFSYPVLFHEPRGLTKEKLREVILWSYRGGTLAADIGMAMANDFERMRRIEKVPNLAWSFLSIIDMILASIYLAAIEEDNDAVRRATISGEFYSALPNVACFVRSLEIKEPVTATVIHLSHVGMDVTAAVVTATTGGILIREANKALDQAKAAT